jgi:DNA-binding response OmpR family regulator
MEALEAIDDADGVTPTAYHRVVVVEDDAALRRIIARNLVGRGLVVQEAETAEEALQFLRAEGADLLLLDVNLPGRSGWDVLRELRSQGREVPTVVISAVRASPNRLAEFHPLAYLPKPFPLESLLHIVFGRAEESGDAEDVRPGGA